MKLIIVESPTKAKTISRFVGSDFQVLATMGHVRDLPKKKLGIDVEHNFRPQYVLVAGKRETISKLKEQAQKADQIYLATDLDREGEAIAYHVWLVISKFQKKNQGQKPSENPKEDKFWRITFHEITKSAIEKAMNSPGKINLPLVNAQQARRVLDRLVGYKLSPLLWRKIRKGLSAGRVQSVAVRLIVEREREIEKFIPEEYWDINCKLRKKIGQKREDLPTFLAKLIKKNGETVKINNKLAAEEIVQELKKAGYEVEKVEQKEVKKSPPPPFITSTLQRTAFARLGYSSKQTMRLAQSLYEKGLISYHRTDSVALSVEAMAMIRKFIKDKYSQSYLTDQPRFYKTRSKLAQEAHEAIRPTNFDLETSGITNQIEERGKRLYDLIFKRAVACQMKPALYDLTKVWVRAEGGENLYTLLATGQVIKFAGWLILYDQKNQVSTGEQILEKLPPLASRDELFLEDVLSEQKFTQPPPRYNEASLIKALEEKGIGRPSTYAPTIATIFIRQYVEREDRKIKPTPLGITVNDFLLEYFPNIFDYDFTAKMEEEFDEIARGEKEWAMVINDFYEPFNQKLEGVAQVAERVRIPTETIGEKCPECHEGELVIRVGRFGKFISCSRFPQCKYTRRFIEKLEGVKCPKCGGDIVVKKTKKGRQFFGCSNYPKCNWASWRKPKSDV